MLYGPTATACGLKGAAGVASSGRGAGDRRSFTGLAVESMQYLSYFSIVLAFRAFYDPGQKIGADQVAREQRKLAAILAADVVGYSRLMGRDESGTLARLRKIRSERLDPVLAKYGGRLVKLTGDGALVEFASAVDALSAAIEFQQAMTEAKGDEPADTALVFRMGLHLGDLIVDGDDLYGDGVNVAARLEGEAPAGGVLISGHVRDAVAGRLKATFEDLGGLSLKNIERPLQAFSVQWERSDWQISVTPEAPTASAAASQLPLPDKPSIAVLPFQNMSGDPEQEYFVDGLVEDIITALSRFKSLFVIARNSSFTYKGKSVDIKQVGRALGVRYVLEGSVRRAGNRVRITGQLIDVANAAHIWADRFDSPIEDVFELQDSVTQSVVGIIGPKVTQAEARRAHSKSGDSLRGYDLLLRALSLIRATGPIELKQAIDALRHVVEIEPTSARAFGHLAMACWMYVAQGIAHRDDPLVADMVHTARMAVALDAEDSEVLALAAWVIGLADGDLQTALGLAEKATTLNPNHADAYRVGAILHGYLGHLDEALENQRQAERLNPLDGGAMANMGYVLAYFGVSAYEEVVDFTMRILRERPNIAPALRYRAASLALLGRVGEARQVVARILEQTPGYTITEVRRHHEFDMHSPFKGPGVTESLYRGLQLAGLPE